MPTHAKLVPFYGFGNIAMRLTLRVLATLILPLLEVSDFNAFVMFWATFFYTIPILIFIFFLVLPIELILARFEFEIAILAIAPLMGWLVPHAFDSMGYLPHEAATELVITGKLGLWCGSVWAISFVFLGYHQCNPDPKLPESANQTPQGK